MMVVFGDEVMFLFESFVWWLLLDVLLVGWYVFCDWVIEFVSILVMVIVFLVWIVDEICILNCWEIGELEVGWM